MRTTQAQVRKRGEQPPEEQPLEEQQPEEPPPEEQPPEDLILWMMRTM